MNEYMKSVVWVMLVCKWICSAVRVCGAELNKIRCCCPWQGGLGERELAASLAFYIKGRLQVEPVGADYS